VSPNDTRGRGGSQSVTWHFFQNFELYSCFFDFFFEGKRLLFLQNQNVTSQRGKGGACQWHQMTHRGGGGSKIGQKSVTYYLNGPLKTNIRTFCTTELDYRLSHLTLLLTRDYKDKSWAVAFSQENMGKRYLLTKKN